MCVLWGDVVSESARIIGTGNGIFVHSAFADGGRAQRTVHYHGCGEFENNVDAAGSGSRADLGGDACGRMGSGHIYDPGASCPCRWSGIRLCAVVVRQDGSGCEIRDPLDQLYGTMEHDRGLSFGCFGQFVEIGKGGGVAFRLWLLGIFRFDVLHGCCRGGH